MGMNTLLVIGLIVVGIIAIARAIIGEVPDGWEDEEGFHYGKR